MPLTLLVSLKNEEVAYSYIRTYHKLLMIYHRHNKLLKYILHKKEVSLINNDNCKISKNRSLKFIIY